MEEKEIESKEFQGNISFLNSILIKTNSLIEHMDTQINIIVGVSSAIFIYSSSQTNSTNHWVFPILSTFSALSIIVGLFAVHPPRSMRKKGQRESIFYTKIISEHSSSDHYSEKIGDMLGDISKIKDQYTCEIYNMSSYYYQPKRRLYRWSRDALLCGIILAALAYILGPLIK